MGCIAYRISCKSQALAIHIANYFCIFINIFRQVFINIGIRKLTMCIPDTFAVSDGIATMTLFLYSLLIAINKSQSQSHRVKEPFNSNLM